MNIINTFLYYSFLLYAKTALARTKKKCSLRNEKLNPNRALETEEQRKARLRIRRDMKKIEQGEQKKIQEEKKRSSETEDHEKQIEH